MYKVQVGLKEKTKAVTSLLEKTAGTAQEVNNTVLTENTGIKNKLIGSLITLNNKIKFSYVALKIKINASLKDKSSLIANLTTKTELIAKQVSTKFSVITLSNKTSSKISYLKNKTLTFAKVNATILNTAYSNTLLTASTFNTTVKYSIVEAFRIIKRLFNNTSVLIDNLSLSFNKNIVIATTVLEISKINYLKNTYEISTIIDNFTRTFNSNRTFNSSYSGLDFISIKAEKNINNTGSFTDSKTIDTNKLLQNSGNVLDSFNKVFNSTRNFTEDSDVTDLIYLNPVKNLSDITNLIDNYSSAINYVRNFSSDLDVTDDINGTLLGDDQKILFFKVLSNNSTIIDNFTRTFNRPLNTNYEVQSNGLVAIQNYADGYFLEDYVGEARVFN